MKLIKVNCIKSHKHLDEVKERLSSRDIENMKLDIEFLIDEMDARRSSNITYSERLLIREMLEKGYLLAHIGAEGDFDDPNHKREIR